MSFVEHVNLTVADAKTTANQLCALFDWHIRWEGEGQNGLGYSIHVGDKNSYIALYTRSDGITPQTEGKFNHVGIVVKNLEEIEERVKAAGYKPHLHADYEPGKRFYYNDDNGIEFEVISYA